MVRNYKRKTDRTERNAVENIERALRVIAIGTSIRAVARDYGIAYGTLREHWLRNRAVEIESTTETTTSAEIVSTAETSTTATIESTTEATTSAAIESTTETTTTTIVSTAETTTAAAIVSTAATTASAPRKFVIATAGHPTVRII